MDAVKDDKYVVFKRDEFMEAMHPQALNHASAELKTKEVLDLVLPDAVVIRRQDYFAAPALNAYASCIAIAARLMQHDLVRQQDLISVADYFHQQAELAAEEGWKLPD
jgi:hypothetical protein